MQDGQYATQDRSTSISRLNVTRYTGRFWRELHSQSRTPHCAGSLQRLDGVSHVKNFQIVAFDELKTCAKLLVADFAFSSLSQQADHPGDAHVRRGATHFLELESGLRKQSF